MPVFEINANGKTFEVEAPSQDAAMAAFQGVQSQRGVADQLLGLTGPRYQTWPERLIRDVAGIPEEAITAAQSATPGSRDATEAMIAPAAKAAMALAPVNPAVRAGARAIPGATQAFRPVKPKVPTTQELAAVGRADIQAAKQSGLEIAPNAVAEYSRKIQQELFDGGIHPVDAEKTFLKLKELENAPSGSVFTAANLQSFRESLGATAQNFNPNAAKDQLAASRAIKRLDEFLPAVNAADVVAGTPAATAKLFEQGRGNYAAAQRSNDLTGVLDRANTGILDRAEARAQGTHSGRNIDNTIRQKIVSLLEKPKEVSGFTDQEIAGLNQVAAGGPGRNTSRYLGNLLGGGGGLGQALVTSIGAGAGGVTAGIPGAIAGAAIPATVGGGLKSIANALAKRDLRKMDEIVRKRSPLFKSREENPEMAAINPEMKAAILRALMLEQQQ